ncbi:aromatic amino acid aminotransferase, partial [Pseudomonas aeruginosa]|nr:aromatic amino acid aminotransferase [Pseudomonas aeruginosa]
MKVCFSAVEMAPRDPILGLNEAFQRRYSVRKRSTSGVYYNVEGCIPLLRAGEAAEKARTE